MSEDFKIRPSTRTLADRLREHLKVDDKGIIEDGGIFRKIATEDGRDVDRMIEDDNYRSDYIAAHTLAAGEVTREFMDRNKEIGTVSGSFEMGRSTLDVSFERHRRVPNRVRNNETGNFEVDGEKDLFGDATIKFAAYGARGSRGELKKVREFLQDSFRTAFSS